MNQREAIAKGLRVTLDAIWSDAYRNGKRLPRWFRFACWLEYRWRATLNR